MEGKARLSKIITGSNVVRTFASNEEEEEKNVSGGRSITSERASP